MAFRSKSPRRALDELEYLVGRWRLTQVEVVDNILDMKYFHDMLPALARARRDWQIFYEVKANLSRDQVRLLRDAGVNRIQPGIESLSDHVLKLMRKGTTALRNIQLLKWGKEHDIIVEWNILYGFPGETREDYVKMLELLPAIRFLRPPCATGPIRLDRFSPYHNASADFGLTRVRPLSTYRYLYPFDEESLQRIAYYFDFDYEPDTDPTGYAAEVIAYARDWKTNPETGTLGSSRRSDGSLAIVDTRSDTTVGTLVLTGLEQAAYEFCDTLHTGASVIGHLHDSFPDIAFSDQQVYAFLESLVSNRLMVTDGTNYLSLAIQAPPRGPEQRIDDSFAMFDTPPRSPSAYLRQELIVLQA
jgi:ribosomal peptide maturation radical SAM protein 1